LKYKTSPLKVLRLKKGFACYDAGHKMGADIGDNVVLANQWEVAAVIKQVLT
jgi:hypothetical protein